MTVRTTTMLLVLTAAAVVSAVVSAGPALRGALPAAPAVAGYDLERPDDVFELPRDLEEISGLTVLDERHLGAVQDEKGRLYVLEMATGKVVREARFEDDGDYEGIEWTPDGVYVLKSNGTLYRIDNWIADDLEVDTYDTPLSGKYDTEGLAYDADRNRLLIACKEYAGPGLDDKKAIYAFDLATRTLHPEPAFIIDLAAVRASDPNPVNRAIRNALASIRDLSGFKPSALAVNPANGYLYVVSSVLKTIVVLDAAGEPMAMVPMPEALFSQPEGIAFAPSGDLFISNEGAGSRGTLLRFRNQ